MKNNEIVTKVMSLVETEMNPVIGEVGLTKDIGNSVSLGPIFGGVEVRCIKFKSKATLEKEIVQEWKDIIASPH